MAGNIKKTKNLDRRIYDAVGLLSLAELNFEICRDIQGFLRAATLRVDGRASFFILVLNNAFNSSVEILHTLLCSTNLSDIRLRPLIGEIIASEKRPIFASQDLEKANKLYDNLLRDYPNIGFSYDFLNQPGKKIGDELARFKKIRRHHDILDVFDKIKITFENSNFHKIRHQSIAHKNVNLEEPSGSQYLLLDERYLEGLSEIIKRTKILASFSFDYECGITEYQKRILAYLKDLMKTISGYALERE